MANENNGFARTIVTRVTGGLALAAILGAWAFANTRASESDVEDVREEVEAHRVEVDEHIAMDDARAKAMQASTQRIERNINKIGTVLDRIDRNSGGPGVSMEPPR
jgi:hypothetical protein